MSSGIGRRAFLLAIGSGLSLSARGTTAAPGRPQITGVVTHFVQNADQLDHALDLIRDAGFTSIRDEVYWGLVEHERDKLVMPERVLAFVEGALARKISPILTLDYGNPIYDGGNKPRSPEAVAAYARFVGFVAKTFAGRVRDYEIWNEWIGSMGSTTPGSPSEYMALFKPAREAIRAVDPGARVLADQVVIGDATNLRVAETASAGFFRELDGITVHPYFFNRGPDRTPEAWAKWMREADEVIRRNNEGTSVPLYVTEVGWPSHLGRFGVSQERQAALAMRLFILARSLSFVPGLWWYDFREDGTVRTDAEDNFGLVTNDLAAKPALKALSQVNRMLANSTFVGSISISDPKVVILGFQDGTDARLWVAWSIRAQTCKMIKIEPREGSILSVMPTEGDAAPVVTPLPHDSNGRLVLSLTETPVFLHGSLEKANIVVSTELQPFSENCRT